LLKIRDLTSYTKIRISFHKNFLHHHFYPEHFPFVNDIITTDSCLKGWDILFYLCLLLSTKILRRDTLKKPTAILLFTNTPHEEARLKVFSPGSHFKVNASIAGELISRTVKKIRKSKLPYVIISSVQQRGESFGERFVNAIEETFEAGFGNVIVIGNDAPQLTPDLLLRASDLIQQNGLVLGPDERGGVYLLGISKNTYSREKLLSIPWKTGSVYNTLCDWGEENKCATETLLPLEDINSGKDLQSLLSDKSISLSFIHAIISMIASGSQLMREHYFFYSNICLRNINHRRGPPASWHMIFSWGIPQ